MRLEYHPETDSLYIHLSDEPGTDVVEVSEDMLIDLDANGNPVGIDLHSNASRLSNLSMLDLSGISLEKLSFTSESRQNNRKHPARR